MCKLVTAKNLVYSDKYRLKKVSEARKLGQLRVQEDIYSGKVGKRIAKKYLLADSTGRTGMHYAAERGNLNHIPQKLFTSQYLGMPCNAGCTVIHLAAAFRCLDQLPTKLLTRRAMLTRDLDERSPLRYAIDTNNWKQLPTFLLTTKNLTIKDNGERTAVHAAARNGQLHRLPPEVITKETMLMPDARGITPLHLTILRGYWSEDATAGDFVQHVPQAILTEENLLTKWANPHNLPDTEPLYKGCPTIAKCPLFYIGDLKCTEVLVGIELSEACRPIVGDQEYNKYLTIRQKTTRVTTSENTTEIEMF